MNLDDALGRVYKFLDANRSETVIVSIKEGEQTDAEGNTQSFEATLRTYIEAKKEYWYTDSVIPQLGMEGDPSSVRGKAILFRRFGIKAQETYGIKASDWPDNTTFSIPQSWTPIIFSVQDYYNTGVLYPWRAKEIYQFINDKYNFIFRQLTAASKDSSVWYINFTSGIFFWWSSVSYIPNIPNIPLLAGAINNQVSGFLTSKSGHFGTIVMDFMTPEIAKKIYESSLPSLATTISDPDHDGTTTAQEIANATDPFTSIRIENAGYHIRVASRTPLNSPLQITTDTNPTSFEVKGLPEGLKVDNATGAISGTPEQSGRFRLSLKAKNPEGQTVATSWDLRVEARPNSRYAGSLKFKVNQRVNILPRAVVAKSWPTYSVASGALPGGVYLDARTGAIRGHIETSSEANYSFTIRAENSAGASESPMKIKITR